MEAKLGVTRVKLADLFELSRVESFAAIFLSGFEPITVLVEKIHCTLQ